MLSNRRRASIYTPGHVHQAHNNSVASAHHHVYLQFTTLLMPRRDVKTFLSFMNEILFPFIRFFFLFYNRYFSYRHIYKHFNDGNNNKNGFTFYLEFIFFFLFRYLLHDVNPEKSCESCTHVCVTYCLLYHFSRQTDKSDEDNFSRHNRICS